MIELTFSVRMSFFFVHNSTIPYGEALKASLWEVAEKQGNVIELCLGQVTESIYQLPSQALKCDV